MKTQKISQTRSRKKMSSRQDRYLEARITQLKYDLSVASDEHDKAWYARLIQELTWVQQMNNPHNSNSYIKKGEREIWM